MATRVSSLDTGYVSGDLSLFPETIDTKDTLYQVSNNAETTLKFGVPYNTKRIFVEDASAFPASGLIAIGSPDGTLEIVYYGSRTDVYFTDLIRGFAGSTQTVWNSGVAVKNSVMAEHHNAVKDAILNTQKYVGTKNNPAIGSLNDVIQKLETRFLSPQAQFRAFPKSGVPPLAVRFQNLSAGNVVRYLWDFGDGTYSIERNPSHTYNAEGYYTVKLTIYTSSEGQGATVKNNYIKVSNDEVLAFFYVTQQDPNLPAYSVVTAEALGSTPAIFNFIDQTDGNIAKRIWVFGDGTSEAIDDPNQHTTTHTYNLPGEYAPILLAVNTDQQIIRVNLPEPITVL